MKGFPVQFRLFYPLGKTAEALAVSILVEIKKDSSMASGQLTPVIRHLRRMVRPKRGDGVSDAQLLDRFVLQNDEAAFELLLSRHGPMVWALCRRILRDHHEAEDAFQATMLILARKARSIGQYHSLASWLFKVAFRIALRARAGSLRRARFTRQLRQWGSSTAWPGALTHTERAREFCPYFWPTGQKLQDWMASLPIQRVEL
jgi:DNA-directed RNA polymerase specialized sigma24 family protein